MILWSLRNCSSLTSGSRGSFHFLSKKDAVATPIPPIINQNAVPIYAPSIHLFSCKGFYNTTQHMTRESPNRKNPRTQAEAFPLSRNFCRCLEDPLLTPGQLCVRHVRSNSRALSAVVKARLRERGVRSFSELLKLAEEISCQTYYSPRTAHSNRSTFCCSSASDDRRSFPKSLSTTAGHRCSALAATRVVRRAVGFRVGQSYLGRRFQRTNIS